MGDSIIQAVANYVLKELTENEIFFPSSECNKALGIRCGFFAILFDFLNFLDAHEFTFAELPLMY